MRQLLDTSCEKLRKSVKTERDKKDVETLIGIWLGKYQCIASEDPRLKEK
jgi:hypothetical protein